MVMSSNACTTSKLLDRLCATIRREKVKPCDHLFKQLLFHVLRFARLAALSAACESSRS
jgi:hypothetical protein